MRHLDPDDLALLALGEVVDGAAHLAECAVCSAEVDSLRQVVAVGRASSRGDVPSTNPPEGVWERIQAELALAPSSTSPSSGVPLSGSPLSDSPLSSSPSSSGQSSSSPSDAAPAQPRGTAGAAAEPDAPDAVVHVLAARRRRLAGWIAGAAAAGVLVGALGGAWWASRPAPQSGGTLLAEAALDPLPGWDAAGTAQVRQDEDGTRVVVVDVDAALGEDAFREVWLIAPDLSGMVSLGLLEGTSGEFVLPAGVDLGRYPVVDVSEEPFDGDATHSGNSIVRGTLGA